MRFWEETDAVHFFDDASFWGVADDDDVVLGVYENGVLFMMVYAFSAISIILVLFCFRMDLRFSMPGIFWSPLSMSVTAAMIKVEGSSSAKAEILFLWSHPYC